MGIMRKFSPLSFCYRMNEVYIMAYAGKKNVQLPLVHIFGFAKDVVH